jgi:hypothetical protein
MGGIAVLFIAGVAQWFFKRDDLPNEFTEKGIRAKVPNEQNFLGMRFKIREEGGIEVKAKSITKMQIRPTHYLINDTHPISILDFYHQVEGEEVDPEMLKLFNEQTFEVGVVNPPEATNVH